MATGEGSAREPAIIIKRDYWLVDGIPVYALPLAEAAATLRMKEDTLKKRLERGQAPGKLGADGKWRMRIRDIHDIQGFDENMELAPRPATPARDLGAALTVLPFRGGKT
jgi:hypothetical protein